MKMCGGQHVYNFGPFKGWIHSFSCMGICLDTEWMLLGMLKNHAEKIVKISSKRSEIDKFTFKKETGKKCL